MDEIEGLHLIANDQTVWASILSACMAQKGFEAFLVPVDWKGWGLNDYLDIVKEPMDLGTIQTKLKAGKYSTWKEFYGDFRLVVDNCKVYNQRTSDIHKSADKLDKFFEKEVNKAVKKAGGQGKTKGITTEERDKFCKALFQLKPIEIGKVLIMLEDLAPNALDKTAKDEIDVNVDLIPGEAYRKVELYVRDLIVSREGTFGGGSSNNTTTATTTTTSSSSNNNTGATTTSSTSATGTNTTSTGGGNTTSRPSKKVRVEQ
jgi:hypothetical protein